MSMWSDWEKNCNKNNQKYKNYGNLSSTSKLSSNWTFSGKNNSPFGNLPTNEEMAEAILNRVDDEGFFRDCLEWLRKMAPRKVRIFLKKLDPSPGPRRVTYDDLCEAVHQMGFRASEILERRMILGSTNKSVQEYFDDFPFGEQK